MHTLHHTEMKVSITSSSTTISGFVSDMCDVWDVPNDEIKNETNEKKKTSEWDGRKKKSWNPFEGDMWTH